ncbi:MAG: hypothetical protein ACRDXX_02995, partial [Stackebrandtia sp.]
MVDYAQLRNLDTLKLTTAAEAAGGLSGTMSNRGGQVASAAAIPAGMWAGADAATASSLMSPLSGPLYDVSDSASRSQGVLEDLVSELKSAQSRLDDAHDLAAGTGITIGADGAVTTPVVNDAGTADANDALARQIRNVIDEAVRMANQADDVAVGALASAGGLLGPPESLGGWGWAAYGTRIGVGRAGNVASWFAKTRVGRFAPRGPDGRFISPKNMTPLQKALAATNGDNFVAKSGKAGVYSKLSTGAKWASRASGVGAVGIATADQVAQDWNDSSMSGAEKGGRAAYRGAVQGGAAWGGAVVG